MKKTNKYDVVIIGGGISGLLCAYRLIENNKKLKITLLEKGNDLDKRLCPIVSGKSKKCIKCAHCSIMEGLAGAGAFSDGKYNITTEYGGWLPDILDADKVMDYILEADKVLMKFGACKETFTPNDDLKKLCLHYDLHMQQARVKHLGTDANYNTMLKLIKYLKEKIDIVTLADVVDVNKKTHTVIYQKDKKKIEVVGDNIVFAVGRVGSRWFKKWLESNKIETINNQVDIGVRVELPSSIWEHFSKKIYEPKIIYKSGHYGDTCRMFCFNERGHVVVENTDGVLTVNGHSYKDEKLKSNNSNFALLVSNHFTEPFKETVEYARSISSLANDLSGGSVLVQRLGDLEKGQRTTERRLKKSSVKPTLNATPGDLSLCLPKRQLDDIIETLHALDKVAPGTANYDTLLYGVECKFYSSRPKANNFELDGTKKIYAIGDGAGFTRSLSQAGANGLIIGDVICGK